MKKKFYFFSSDSFIDEELKILEEEDRKAINKRIFYSNNEITFASDEYDSLEELKEEILEEKDSIFSIEFLYDTSQKSTMRKVFQKTLKFYMMS